MSDPTTSNGTVEWAIDDKSGLPRRDQLIAKDKDGNEVGRATSFGLTSEVWQITDGGPGQITVHSERAAREYLQALADPVEW